MTQQFGFNSPVPPVAPAADIVDGVDDMDRDVLDDQTLDEGRVAQQDSVDADRDASYDDDRVRGVEEPREDEPTIIKSPDLT